MPDLRASAAYLLRLRISWRPDDLAAIAAVPLPRARAFTTELARKNALVVKADGSLIPGVYARRWLALIPKTRPGGNATEYRRQREVREQLELRAWQARRTGTLIPVPDYPDSEGVLTSQETPIDDTGEHMSPTASTTRQPTNAPVPATFTLEQAAIALQQSTTTVRRRIHDGTLKAVRVGPREIRIPVSEVTRLLTVSAETDARRG